jgi:hypothetical protein
MPRQSSKQSDEITVTMTRVEALALARVADTGIKVTEVLGLIQNTRAAERGMNKLNAAAARASDGRA